MREGWRQRWLFSFFALKSLEKLYARTWLGVLWLPLRPGVDLLLKVGVIGTLIGSPSPGVPYLLYVLVGMTAWELFEKLAFWATRALELNRSVLRRVYVPRLTVLTGAFGPAGVYFAMYVAATALAVLYFALVDGTTHLSLGVQTLALPAGLALLALVGLTVGMFLAPIAVHARDVRFALTYGLGLWFFLTPILYPPARVDGFLRLAVEVNPITAPIALVKHGLLGTPLPATTPTLVCLATLSILVPVGLGFFGRSEKAGMDAV